jgi:hypothetical protein
MSFSETLRLRLYNLTNEEIVIVRKALFIIDREEDRLASNELIYKDKI